MVRAHLLFQCQRQAEPYEFESSLVYIVQGYIVSSCLKGGTSSIYFYLYGHFICMRILPTHL